MCTQEEEQHRARRRLTQQGAVNSAVGAGGRTTGARRDIAQRIPSFKKNRQTTGAEKT